MSNTLNDVFALEGAQPPGLPRSAAWLADSSGGTYVFTKRVLDLAGAVFGLLLLSPLLLLVALAVRLDSRGAIFYRQMRVGLRGHHFGCWKFRSMVSDADARKSELQAQNEMEGGTTFKMKRDPRITRVGRFIRRASIDELPQLWNVLRGDMSLVGPRPPVPSEVETYTAHQRLRLSVKPGLTCLWQVSGRSDLSFREQVRLDIRYIETRSLATDLLLLLRTIPAVLSARGAY